MNETTANWDDFRLFLAVARGGGLAAASTATGKSSPTLGRRMVALEKRMGCDLFVRHPRGYDLTGDGERLLSDLAQIESRIVPLSDRHGLKGRHTVKISAGTWMTHVLCQQVRRITGDGDVAVRFIAADHVLDIRHREAVIGVRNQRPDQIGLAGRRVGRVDFAAYARHDKVTTWARVVGKTPSANWLAEHSGAAPAIEVSNPRNALDLAVSGAARAILPTFVGDSTAGLERVSQPIEDLSHDQWLVTHEEERFERDVRAVISRIEAILGDLHSPRQR